MFDDCGDHIVGHSFWCAQITICSIIEKHTIGWQMGVDMSKHLQKLVLFHEICEWDIVHEDEALPIKARNDLGLNVV